jgi:hypothetical protein
MGSLFISSFQSISVLHNFSRNSYTTNCCICYELWIYRDVRLRSIKLPASCHSSVKPNNCLPPKRWEPLFYIYRECFSFFIDTMMQLALKHSLTAVPGDAGGCYYTRLKYHVSRNLALQHKTKYRVAIVPTSQPFRSFECTQKYIHYHVLVSTEFLCLFNLRPRNS